MMPDVSVSKTGGNRYDIYTATATGDDRNTYIDTKTVEAQTAQTPVPSIAVSEPSATATLIPQITVAPEPSPVWTDELWFDGEYYESSYDFADAGESTAASSPESSVSPEPGTEPEEENSFTLSPPPKGNLIIKTGNAQKKEGAAREEKSEQGFGLEFREATIPSVRSLTMCLAVRICIGLVNKIKIGKKTHEKSEKSAKTY